MRSQLSLDWQRNRWAPRVGRSIRAWINWLRHAGARSIEHAQGIVGWASRTATYGDFTAARRLREATKGPTKNLHRGCGFCFHSCLGVPKLGGLKEKWTTSSKRENCRSSASISTWNSGRTTAGDSCASLRKLTAAVTASSCRVPASMTLRRRLLKF